MCSKLNITCTTLLIETSPQALPLGAACIASAIKNNPKTKDLCNVELVSFSKEDKLTALQIADSLLKSNPAVVLFSVYVWNIDELKEVSALLKKKGIITVAGGPEITASPEEVSGFDYAVCGEGEESVPELICTLAGKVVSTGSTTTVGGSTAAGGGSIATAGTVAGGGSIATAGTVAGGGSTATAGTVATADRTTVIPPKPVDLPSLTSPYLDGTIDPAKFGGALWELSRGCPFKCTYCFESKGSKTVRQFPIERIKKELELFAAKKVPQVFVLDPTYNADKKRALEILKLIQKITPDTFYYFEARAEFIDHELAKAFTKIPCALQIGLQSTNENTLKLINRPSNLKQFSKGINVLNQEGVTFGLDLIYGLPGESFKSFKEGINYAIGLYPNNLEIFCLSVLPGTLIYEQAEELHLNYDKNPPYNVINTDCFSKEDLQRAKDLSAACGIFYNQGRAVPWFNTICRSLKMRPVVLFEKFTLWLKTKNIMLQSADCLEHSYIQKLQLDFITSLYKEAKLEKYLSAAKDIISFYGALSRVQDTSKAETVTLSYPAEYIDSQYASDLQYFCANVKQKKNTIRISKQNGFAVWK